MSRKSLYPVARMVQMGCALLDVDPAEVLSQAGLPADHLETETHGVNARAYLDAWTALVELGSAGAPGAVLALARAAARQPSHAPIIAFTASRNIRTGLQRLALFKPLAAPVRVSFADTGCGLRIGISMAEPDLAAEPHMGAFDIAFVTELCRHYSGARVVPKKVQMPVAPANRPEYEAWLGCPVATGPEIALEISAEDAARPLLSQNDDLLRGMEQTLRRRLRDRAAGTSISTRVASALAELLPSGKSGADDVCAQLGLSRRSLQRRLQEEGESFRGVLDRTRETLALQYLRDGSMSVPEISYLLAYRDPNSFYRAFQSWTSMTPGEARARLAPLASLRSREVADSVNVA
ncbi:AraC family transcriptional regulator [Mangrovicoccus sp. HB161399]|uniref:AraC family transcriptional regulator n=1 Tax=Mangrovicoccus sp. HB161399 TaxID=2720392 RepID=UPI0015535574|nr:AraC family transcriptional regulator [Mangrovicoccus sp. HB161399]